MVKQVDKHIAGTAKLYDKFSGKKLMISWKKYFNSKLCSVENKQKSEKWLQAKCRFPFMMEAIC